mmetsp:Transcript_3983/g.3452  ORF Transcript_3983/g.3452 Transcript_3983/m.3452 type:complete len:311 (+) Transcript_3983:95-1027(+)|eukprot:CAMPEP_0201566240 /NCGR_PEP_ID=MMETSP0190_2-20130828/5898_1 /ASSEMBLY_ACC=CAM_ASM_000263 /TAXON_ID=37353 /ORGANISM="Rosalina sp." /LENGTH=310 /DNA_ID=CAMNT_0047984703 /DNA_START=95 /DNA_END=1027 /DNA_ORIENTATION=-
MATQDKVALAKEMAQEKFGKMKLWFGDKKKQFDHRITMEGILKQARESFEHFTKSEMLQMEKKISDKLMRDAWGIVFLTEVKVGALAGGKVGTGILITRIENKEDEWSAPIAIGTGGFSFGFQAGVSKVDHIIILPSPNHVKTFLGKGQLQIKGNAEAAVATYGRDANVGVGVNDKGDAAPIMSYSFGVKGLYAGVSIDGACLVPRNKCNETFYGKQVTLQQITSGYVEAPKLNEDYQKIILLIGSNKAINGNQDTQGIVNENLGYQAPSINNNNNNNYNDKENNYDGNLQEDMLGIPDNSEYDQFNSSF